jgi:hypothetical protein
VFLEYVERCARFLFCNFNISVMWLWKFLIQHFSKKMHSKLPNYQIIRIYGKFNAVNVFIPRVLTIQAVCKKRPWRCNEYNKNVLLVTWNFCWDCVNSKILLVSKSVHTSKSPCEMWFKVIFTNCALWNPFMKLCHSMDEFL